MKKLLVLSVTVKLVLAVHHRRLRRVAVVARDTRGLLLLVAADPSRPKPVTTSRCRGESGRQAAERALRQQAGMSAERWQRGRGRRHGIVLFKAEGLRPVADTSAVAWCAAELLERLDDPSIVPLRAHVGAAGSRLRSSRESSTR